MKTESCEAVLDYGDKYRLPFKVAREFSYDGSGGIANIVHVNMTQEYGMSNILASCLQKISVCSDCGAPPFPVERHAKCVRVSMRVEEVRSAVLRDVNETSRHEYRTSYVVCCQVVLAAGNDLIFEDEYRRDLNRAKKFRRRRRHSILTDLERARQRQELFAIHNGHCYYCFGEVEPNAESADFDHFEPMVLGGTSDVWNLVVACKRCNNEKAIIDGGYFKDFKRRQLDISTKRVLMRLQKTVDTWRMQKRSEHEVMLAKIGKRPNAQSSG